MKPPAAMWAAHGTLTKMQGDRQFLTEGIRIQCEIVLFVEKNMVTKEDATAHFPFCSENQPLLRNVKWFHKRKDGPKPLQGGI